MGIQDRDYYRENLRKKLDKDYFDEEKKPKKNNFKKEKRKPEKKSFLNLLLKASALLGTIFMIMKIVLKANNIQ